MTQFRYVARTATLDKVTGIIDASDRETAISAVEAMGHSPISVSDSPALPEDFGLSQVEAEKCRRRSSHAHDELICNGLLVIFFIPIFLTQFLLSTYPLLNSLLYASVVALLTAFPVSMCISGCYLLFEHMFRSRSQLWARYRAYKAAVRHWEVGQHVKTGESGASPRAAL